MTSDFRSAWRAIWRSPTTTIGALLALALGVGATTTIFGVFNAVLLRPLPYPQAERLVEIYGTVQRERIERRGASYPDYFDWRDQTRSFDGMASWQARQAIVYGSGEPAQVSAETVDGPYLELLGAQAIRGRLFQPGDHGVEATPVAVIGERLWEQQFNRGSDVIGRSIQLDSRVYTIVGIVPAGFRGRSDAAMVWTPAATTESRGRLAARGSRGFAVLARLETGVTRDAAQADINALSVALERAHPDTNEKRSADVVFLADELFQQVRPAVQVLFAAVTAVLLIAGANVASLLLARNEGRRREISLRRALGADDRRLARLLLTESAIMVVLGGGAGWLLSLWTRDALLALSPVQLPTFARLDTDWRALVFVSAVGVVTTVAIGLTPLRSSRRGSLAQSLREGATESRGGSGSNALRLIVVGQITVAVALLVAAVLLGRSFAALVDFDPGFEPDGMLSVRVRTPPAPPSPAGSPPAAVPPNSTALALLDQIRAVAGVRQASMTNSIPLVDAGAVFYAAEGMPPVDATNRPRAYIHLITSGYFDTLKMRMVEGRDFASTEMGGQQNVVIVSENVARRFWPGQSAIGRRLTPGDPAAPNTQWLTIVGVVGEANLRGIPRNPTADPDLYVPFNTRAQSFAVLISGAGDPAALVSPVRDVLRSSIPGVAVFDVRTFSELVDGELATARFLSWLTGAFAATALTLAVIGMYGTLSYWVRRRTTEIGVRTALGANHWRLLGLVVGHAMMLAGAGLILGVLIAAGLTRYLETQLFAVTPADWISFGGTTLIIMAAAITASLAPALRAVRLDPVVALRGR